VIRKSHPAILQNGSLNDVIYSHSLPLSVSLHLCQVLPSSVPIWSFCFYFDWHCKPYHI